MVPRSAGPYLPAPRGYLFLRILLISYVECPGSLSIWARVKQVLNLALEAGAGERAQS